jgi:hypothetical protein
VPFTVSVPFDTIGRTPDGTLTVEPREGGGTTVHWPIRFSYVETDGSSTDFTLDVQPDRLDLEYSWHVTGGMPPPPLMSPMPRLLSPGGGCFQADGTNVMLICQGDCGCDGCTLEGNAYLMGHSFSLPTFQCGCSPPTDPDQEPPGEPDPSRPSISVSYNAPAVIYEAAYVDVPGHTVGKRSTQVTLSISVGSGPRGGHYSVNLPGFGRLVQTEPANIPVSGDLGPYETVFFSVTCEGCAPSSEEGDVEISGVFVENGTGCRFTSNGSKLTVFRVELKQTIVPIGDTAAGRHTFGVNELVECNQHPSIPLLEWDTSGGGTMCIVSEKEHYRCPLFACGNPLSIRFGSIVYGPQLSILAPTGVVARNPHVYKFTNVPDGHAGGLGLAQEFHVLPDNVSFSQIAVEEVPCDSSQLTGYFRKLADAGDPAPFSHTTNAGAGVWFNVNELNRIGGNEQIEDMVSIKGELYRMFPDGTLTTNTACGWLRGTMVWENPFGWNANGVSSGTSAYGQFAVSQTNVNDVFVITTNGHFSVSKFGNTAIRACGGGCYLNGSPTIPTEVFWNGTD